MRSILIILMIVSTYTIAFSQNKSLKVITYNIWNGYDFGEDEGRRKEVANWIGDQKPSIVALQELCKYTTEKLAEDARSWGHEYSVLLKTTGYSVGLTSAFPIEVKEKIIEGMHHGALHCRTSGIDLFVIHFSPGSYLKRREEAAVILDKLKEVERENDRFIVLGDFNAHSPVDADLYDPKGALLTRLRESNKEKPVMGNLFNGHLDFAVISSILAFPLIDVCQPFTKGMAERGSFPAQVLGEINKESKEDLIARMERIDYIMVSPKLASRCINAKIYNGEDNYFLSDHYPVMATFEIEN